MKKSLINISAGFAILAIAALQCSASETENDTVSSAIDPLNAPLESSQQAFPNDISHSIADTIVVSDTTIAIDPEFVTDSINMSSYFAMQDASKHISIYALPYSMKLSNPNWKRMWTNTAVLSGAFVGTLLVLECLPEDATTWNRAELQQVPLFKRWWEHVVEKGPEWDHDNPIFNFILHPYAGAVYFMSARSCGFNFYQSLLYCSLISTVEWEFGIEAFMERPSIQDIFITPLVGSAIGEGFYHVKRHIVDNDYCMFGSPIIGNAVAFLIDPVNEVIGLFGGNDARQVAKEKNMSMSSSWSVTPKSLALNVNITF